MIKFLSAIVVSLTLGYALITPTLADDVALSVGDISTVKLFCSPGNDFERLKDVHRNLDKGGLVALFAEAKSECYSTDMMGRAAVLGLVTRLLGRGCIADRKEIRYVEFKLLNVDEELAKERFISWMSTGNKCTNV